MFFPEIDALRELIKSFYVFQNFDKTKAATLLTQINALREYIAVQAEQRQNFYSQINVPANSQDLFFETGDISSVVRRGIAKLEQDTLLALLHQGLRQNILTRERVAWQQLFSNVQEQNAGQQLAFDLPQEIFLQPNESINFSFTNQDAAGYIFLHGARLKDDYSPNTDDIKAEINQFNENGFPLLPQTQLIPLLFEFTGAAGTYAVAPDNAEQIRSVKSDRSVILTHVSVTTPLCRLTLIDEGRNQEFCDLVEMAGIASTFTNQYTTYYPLPYPHLLRRNDNLKVRVLNGSIITGTAAEIGVINYLTFYGQTI